VITVEFRAKQTFLLMMQVRQASLAERGDRDV
jgi:hypothetical protein